jgi:hypothetical protein
MTKSIVIFLFLTMNLSIACQAQVGLSEKDFTSKNILSSIFKGQFQEALNVQKWPVSAVQALEMSSFLDWNRNAYTAVDSILNLRIDTSQYKIAVLKTFQVDSSGGIQDYYASVPKMGMAVFSRKNNSYELLSFRLEVLHKSHGWILPEYRFEKIGPAKVALVFKEDAQQDLGKEFWIEISNELITFLTYDYISLTQGEKSTLIENSIEIVPTESELYDLILNSKITPTDDIDSEKAAKIKPVKTKLIYNNTDMMQHVQMPFGYSIQPK